MINECIAALADHAIDKGLIDPLDRAYTINRLLEILELHEYEEPAEKPKKLPLVKILDTLTDYAVERGLCSDSIVYRDLFDTKLMGAVTPPPSVVNAKFWEDYKFSSRQATFDHYRFSKYTNYIRSDRIAKDVRWKTETEYGELDVTINLSKPEKDPKAIAAAKNAPKTGYPKCRLCCECEGYSGRADYPARQNHRIINLNIAGEEWGFQYSPYSYYREHCIVLNKKHTPMVIDRRAFEKLMDFVRQFPAYFVGSNADLPIVGGSILAHEHFQGGCFEFAMERAETETKLCFDGFEDVEAGIVKWPMSVIRISGSDIKRLCALADKILGAWRGYSDRDAFIFAETEGEPHNTITPIARKRGGLFEFDLVLRNNITTREHPLGVYHPHAELHHIKKENIGLIEVMGLAVLPSRLKTEMELLSENMVKYGADFDVGAYPELEKHKAWAEDIISRRSEFCADNADDILKQEIGSVFLKVLEHAGVYKRTDEGKAAFLRFTEYVNSRAADL